MEPPAARLSGLLSFQQLTPQLEVQAIPVDYEEFLLMPSRAPVRCSSSVCSGNTEQFATNSGTLLSFQMWHCRNALHDMQRLSGLGAPVQCSDDGGECRETTEELSTASYSERVPAPLQPFQDPLCYDQEMTCLRAPVQECCSGADPGSHEQFAVSDSIQEMNFNKEKSVLVC